MLGVVGIVVGSTMGVVALGDGVNGAVVFGPLGFLIGWLMPQNASPPDQKQQTADAKGVEPKSQD